MAIVDFAGPSGDENSNSALIVNVESLDADGDLSKCTGTGVYPFDNHMIVTDPSYDARTICALEQLNYVTNLGFLIVSIQSGLIHCATYRHLYASICKCYLDPWVGSKFGMFPIAPENP